MKNKTTKISIRIIALFSAAILISMIPNLFPNFFGDWICEGRTHKYDENIAHYVGCDYGVLINDHNPNWHWGYQHWLFFAMGVSLSIVQIVDIISIANKEDVNE